MKRIIITWKAATWTALLCLCLLLTACDRLPEAQVLAHGRFSSIGVYHQNDNVGPPVLLISDSATDAAVTRKLLVQMLEHHADVFIINTSTLREDFADDIAQCNNLSGDFENLARYLEAYLQLPGFTPPILVTTSTSNTPVARLLAPVSPQVFVGQLRLTASAITSATENAAGYPACANTSVAATSSTSFDIAVDDDVPDAQQLDDAFDQLSLLLPEQHTLDESVAGLPLTELPGDETASTFAILISGDGGWAGFDKELAAALQKEGIGVVGWDSLRYFWQPRTPESLAEDIDRVITHYQQEWHKQRVILMGFSQGANVLPFALAHLDNSSSEAVAAITLISPEQYAQFEFHLSSWVHAADEGLPLVPVLSEYRGAPVYCIYGSQDEATVCPMLEGTEVEVKGFDAGHHLYEEIPAIVDLLRN